MPSTVWAMIPDPITKINVIFTDDQNTGSWIMRVRFASPVKLKFCANGPRSCMSVKPI